MVSVIREKETKGEGLQQQRRYNNYLPLDSSAYSLFVIAMRSPQTKEKYLQRFGYFLDFAQVAKEKDKTIEERCNELAGLGIIYLTSSNHNHIFIPLTHLLSCITSI